MKLIEMENTELRLLNWVLHKDTQRYGKVVSLQYEAESYKDNETYIEVWDGWKETYYVCRPSHIEPIPLTEEILFKAGFERGMIDCRCGTEIYYEKDTVRFFIYHKKIYLGDCYEGCDGDLEFYFYENCINYVHQLQNLYFALDGKELEINLD